MNICTGCSCPETPLYYISKQLPECEVKNGYCLELSLFTKTESKFVEFRKFNFSQKEFNNLKEADSTLDIEDHSVKLVQNEKKLHLEIYPASQNTIVQSEFEMNIFNKTIGFQEGYNYSFEEKPKKITISHHHFTSDEINDVTNFGTTGGEVAKYATTGADAASFFEVTLGLGGTGMLMNFSQTIKLISMFRFISVYFGGLMEPFLAGGGEALEPKSPWEKNLIQMNQVGSRRKITFYNKAITTIDSFHYKTILYFMSFIIRAIEKSVVDFMKKKRKINKVLFYFVFIHNRVHFVLLNIFLSGGVFLNTRTLLHMKMFPETWILMFDKLLALIVFFFYWSDICEMFATSMKYVRIEKDEKKKAEEL